MSAPAPAVATGRASPLRVMIVDDSLVARSVLSRILDSQGDIAIVAKATTAEMALTRLADTPVDVLLLDLEMPGMGGINALPALLTRIGAGKILVVSALTAHGAEQTLAALSLGAADTLLKPTAGQLDERYAATLLAKVRALAPDRGARGDGQPISPAIVGLPGVRRPQAIGIGASTGGIHAMCRLLEALPAHCDMPIVVAQHLPESFMPVLARQLAAAVGRPATVAEPGMALLPGTITIAPGTGHLIVRAGGGRLIAAIDSTPAASGCMPSADPLFGSLADATGGAAIAVVLSGMGRDGCEGARTLSRSGGTVFAQDAESSAVWGMPRAVVEAEIAAAALSPEAIARRIGMIVAQASPPA